MLLLEVFNNKLEEDLTSEGQLGTINKTSDFTSIYNEYSQSTSGHTDFRFECLGEVVRIQPGMSL